MKQYFDLKYNFREAFKPETGFMIRSGIYENGKETNTDPFMRSFPSLIDCGIMGSCVHGKSGLCKLAGTGCYQSGGKKEFPNMSLENYKNIIDQSKGKVWEIALGGRGDPNKHENFKEILEYTRENGIVPNYTTSGLMLEDEEIEYSKLCGAVAVSEYNTGYTHNAITSFIRAGIKTNVHYILGESSYEKIIERLENRHYDNLGINAIIFLLHKNIGEGKKQNVLSIDHAKEFFEFIDSRKFSFKIGFDSCSSAGLVNYSNVDRRLFDTCEGARFSCYVSADMVMTPCSFDQELRWGVDLKENTMQEAWNSILFSDFRSRLSNSCVSCKDRVSCFGGCHITRDIVLCRRKERES
jgi:radical SAM protein with 4Fe4S-binding SPASM domain